MGEHASEENPTRLDNDHRYVTLRRSNRKTLRDAWDDPAHIDGENEEIIK